MKVKTLVYFNDLKSKKLRKAGEIFEASESRARELSLARNGTLIEIIEDKKEEAGEAKGGEKIGSSGRSKGSAKN